MRIPSWHTARFLVLPLALIATSASGGPIRESWIVPDVPTQEQADRWSQLPGTRSYLIQTRAPATWELETIARIRGASGLRIEVRYYPTEDTVPAWKALAARGTELVALDAGFPNDGDVERLNRIGFRSIVIVSTAFPGADDGRRLARLKARVALTFATRMYPRFVDKPSFETIPASVPTLFSTDYWPWYVHMDVLNMLPQPKKLRVKDMFPPEESLPYLHNVRSLDEVVVDTDFDAPDASEWTKFRALRVRWNSRGRAPSPAGLAAFEASARGGGERSLIVDSDSELLPEEQARLERSALAVEWVRVAPGFLRRR